MAINRRLDEYLSGPEVVRPQEMEFGVVREPPAPVWGHQAVVVRTLVLLEEHVREHGLGRVGVAPTDVVLDEAGGLIVQPDLFFVAADRLDIIRDVVWGAPDLVVEVMSRRTALRDRTVKLSWYREYAVRECWLVDPEEAEVEVVVLARRARPCRTIYRGSATVRSSVLPGFAEKAASFFD